MAHYKTHFLHTSEDGFIIKPSYMDIHPSYVFRSVIGQLRTSSHKFEIDVGKYAQIPLEERICQLCHQGVESEEHYVCQCSVFYEIRGRNQCLLKQSFGPLCKIMEFEDQPVPRNFLARTPETGKVVEDNIITTQAHPQRTITTFFSPISPNSTSQSRATHMGSRPRHNKGVTIDRAIAIHHVRRPRSHGPRFHRPCHQYIKAPSQVLPSRRRPLHSSLTYARDISKSSYSVSDLRILHVTIKKFFSLFLSYLMFT